MLVRDKRKGDWVIPHSKHVVIAELGKEHSLQVAGKMVEGVFPALSGEGELCAQELGVDITPRLETIRVEEPPKRKGGILVQSVQELVEKLRNEAKVL